MIESGEVDIGFQQISELIRAPGVDYVGPLPAEIQKITVYSAGIHANAKQPEAAKAPEIAEMLEFIRTTKRGITR